ARPPFVVGDVLDGLNGPYQGLINNMFMFLDREYHRQFKPNVFYDLGVSKVSDEVIRAEKGAQVVGNFIFFELRGVEDDLDSENMALTLSNLLNVFIFNLVGLTLVPAYNIMEDNKVTFFFEVKISDAAM